MASAIETFGNYELTARIAIGGMAEVFLATAHGVAGFTKPVVIKRLHPRLNEENEFVQMLIDEAHITAQLTHSNICQVLDLGEVGGLYYIAMEFISGEDLRTMQDHCSRQKVELSIPAAIYILSEVLAGLDYAHRKEGSDGALLGLIHRDISPQNILISYEGEVKIIDFGIAKARLRLVQTQAGVIKGKFRYMSPEQASGEPLDHRTDIFAAGVTLYELLRGGPHSLQLSDTEVLRRMRRAEFEPLRRFRPDVPGELEAIIKKALQRKTSHRYATAADFRAALLDYLDQQSFTFGRTHLAQLMHRVFDSDRRRRRGGSASDPDTRTPSVDQTALLPEPVTGETISHSPEVERADPSPLQPAALVYADARHKNPHDAPITTDAFDPDQESLTQELAVSASHAFDSGRRTLEHGPGINAGHYQPEPAGTPDNAGGIIDLHLEEDEGDDEDSLPTTTRRRPSSPLVGAPVPRSRPSSGAALHRERTKPLQRPPTDTPSPLSYPESGVADGSSLAAGSADLPFPTEIQSKAAPTRSLLSSTSRRTLFGICFVLVVGTGLSIGLYLFDPLLESTMPSVGDACVTDMMRSAIPLPDDAGVSPDQLISTPFSKKRGAVSNPIPQQTVRAAMSPLGSRP